MMNKEQLQTEMIRMYGFEAPETIEFFELCENEKIDLANLKTIVAVHREHLQALMNEEEDY